MKRIENLSEFTNPNPNDTSVTKTGTGTITSIAEAVTGTSTSFTTELRVGDVLTADANTATVASIEDDENLTLEAPFSSDVTDETFTLERERIVDPFGGLNRPNRDPIQAWIDQSEWACPAFFPNGIRNVEFDERNFAPKVQFFITPSDGDAVTFDVDIFYLNTNSRTWFQPIENSSQSYTGNVQDDFALKAGFPVLFKFSNISSGTLTLDLVTNLGWVK